MQYVIKTVEVESAKAKQALCESQSRNQYLQEQVGMQRQVLKEMEQQLQSSQKTAAQLRAQVGVCRRSSAAVRTRRAPGTDVHALPYPTDPPRLPCMRQSWSGPTGRCWRRCRRWRTRRTVPSRRRFPVPKWR